MKLYVKEMTDEQIEAIKKAFYKMQSSQSLLLECMNGNPNSPLIPTLTERYEKAHADYFDTYAEMEDRYVKDIISLYDINTRIDFLERRFEVKINGNTNIVKAFLIKRGFTEFKEMS